MLSFLQHGIQNDSNDVSEAENTMFCIQQVPNHSLHILGRASIFHSHIHDKLCSQAP